MTPEIEALVTKAEERKHLSPAWPWDHLARLAAEVRRLDALVVQLEALTARDEDVRVRQEREIDRLNNALADGRTAG